MQTKSALMSPRSRRYLQSDLAQIIVKKTLFIPQTESRLACSFLRINYFAIILGLNNSNTNDTAQWQYNSARPCLFSWSSLLRINIHIASRQIRAKHLHIVSKVRNFWKIITSSAFHSRQKRKTYEWKPGNERLINLNRYLLHFFVFCNCSLCACRTPFDMSSGPLSNIVLHYL